MYLHYNSLSGIRQAREISEKQTRICNDYKIKIMNKIIMNREGGVDQDLLIKIPVIVDVPLIFY